MSDETDRLQLDRVAFYGRTLDEYVRIFDLDLDAWKGDSILDCPSGAASFVAEATRMSLLSGDSMRAKTGDWNSSGRDPSRAKGGTIAGILSPNFVACDPMFGESVDVLRERGRSDIEHVLERTAQVAHLYKWEFYTDINALRQHRTRALALFAEDYPKGVTEGRYVKGALPHLPFADRQFDLVLSGHFLFTYADKFDFAFHEAAVRELHRVCAKEVRIYPIQGPDSKPYPQTAGLLDGLRRDGFHAQIESVPFEFQRGSNRMLRLVRSK